ncbi:hypothetical protein [Acetobacter sp. DsW_063]|uniref:hypothetical protein n=1 Tax=Acetobacter sp. DsW_063 TaxID=1514894 RepID=UPI000B67C12E|nr:hypothetical protein [Acetobacter sp. DsW_063]OUJ11762.1 hypothetical protein HK28_04365 [Acetobacter sp. DsW_063]
MGASRKCGWLRLPQALRRETQSRMEAGQARFMPSCRHAFPLTPAASDSLYGGRADGRIPERSMVPRASLSWRG